MYLEKILGDIGNKGTNRLRGLECPVGMFRFQLGG